jgi:glycosyltransferase involved in cell wall biosynthesis
LVQALCHKFDFRILTSDTDYGAAGPYAGIPANVWVPQPGCQVWYCARDAQSYRHVRTLLAAEPWDVLYLNSIFSLRYTIFPLWIARATFPDRRVVLAPRGMLHAGALALKPTKKRIFLKALRWMGLHKQIWFHATDAQEVADIQRVFGTQVKILEASNLPQQLHAPEPLIDKRPGTLRMVYLSRISAKKGVLELLQALRHQTADIELGIYGPDEEPGYWARCEAAIAVLPANVRVEKHPALPPPEVAARLGSYHVFVMPTRGENFGHAIFEALAAGRPVVISDQTPWTGLESASAGAAIPLAETQAWVDAIGRFAAMAQGEWEAYAKGAYAYARDYAQRSDAVAQSEALFAAELGALPADRDR